MSSKIKKFLESIFSTKHLGTNEFQCKNCKNSRVKIKIDGITTEHVYDENGKKITKILNNEHKF